MYMCICVLVHIVCSIATVLTQSQQGSTPEHRGKAALSLVEGRVDYMSSCILLAHATELHIDCHDLWEGLQLGEEPENEQGEKWASIQVKAHFSWQDLQIAIHRSTTQHLFNIVEKMYEFIMQQKRRSERTLSNMLPAGSAASKALKAYRKEQERVATTTTTIRGDCYNYVSLVFLEDNNYVHCKAYRSRAHVNCGSLTHADTISNGH